MLRIIRIKMHATGLNALPEPAECYLLTATDDLEAEARELVESFNKPFSRGAVLSSYEIIVSDMNLSVEAIKQISRLMINDNEPFDAAKFAKELNITLEIAEEKIKNYVGLGIVDVLGEGKYRHKPLRTIQFSFLK